MNAPLQCTNCGAKLTPRDMEKPACPYCQTILPHHAMAAQQAQLVRNMLADSNGNGIPDAYEPMMRAWGGGVAPPPGAPPPAAHLPQPGPGQPIYGAPPQYFTPAQLQQPGLDHANRTLRNVALVWVAVTVGSAVLAVIIAAVVVVVVAL